MSALLTLRDAAFGYEGNTVVKGISFTVEPGDWLCVIGENGSGKSTLMKGLLGLKAPRQGSVSLSGGLRAGEIGYLPQQSPARRDFPAGVLEIVLSGRLASRGIRPFYSRRDREAALSNLERLGISELRNRCYRELSGGQQRRVLLARALCAGSRLLLLDEPGAGLDPEASEGMYSLLERLNKEGLTLIMVTHDVLASLPRASRVLRLSGGEQSFFGDAEEYRVIAGERREGGGRLEQ